MKLRDLFYNFKSTLAILACILLAITSGFNLYVSNYTEDFTIDYLSQRITVLLLEDRYLETYKLHDYVTDFNSFIPVFVANQSSGVEYSVQSNDPRGINTKVTEKTDGVLAEVYSELTRQSPTQFKLNRQYKFVESTDFNRIEKVHMQLILGGGEFQFDQTSKTVFFEQCSLKLNTLTNVDLSYNSEYKVVTLSQRVFGQKLLSFNIDFTLDCTK